jgi:hypothetical protein
MDKGPLVKAGVCEERDLMSAMDRGDLKTVQDLFARYFFIDYLYEGYRDINDGTPPSTALQNALESARAHGYTAIVELVEKNVDFSPS